MNPYIRLYNLLHYKIKQLFDLLKNTSACDPELRKKLTRLSEELVHISDHTKHEIEDLKPIQSEDALKIDITPELYKNAFNECIQNRDFSLSFLQQSFHLDFLTARELQDRFKRDNKIKTAFIVNDVICKA